MENKGFSPVIAVVLMVAIAVAASVMAYLWATGLLTGTTQGTQEGQITNAATISIVNVDVADDIVSIRCSGDATSILTVEQRTSAGAVNVCNADTANDVACAAGDTGTVDIEIGDGATSPGCTSGTGFADDLDLVAGDSVTVTGTNNAQATKTA